MGKKCLGKVELPLQRVHIELTNVCDFDCVFCPKSDMTRSYGFMDFGLVKRLIDEIKEHEVCDKITFHVMGEPTLHPNFFEILDYAKDKGVKVGLTTNGGGLGKKVGEKLAKYNLYQLDISIQTPDEKSYPLRKAGNLGFDDYINGILEFFKAYREVDKDTIIKFRFMNTRFKKKGLEKKKGPVEMMSSTKELQETFQHWVGKVYDIIGVDEKARQRSLEKLGKLVSYKWNVVEIHPNLFFETYVLSEWGHAFDYEETRDAWAGYCYGMRDHFAILYNGDVTLCCIDFDGKTKVGNVTDSSLEEVLSSEELGEIIQGFKRFKLVHPHCKKCLGSTSFFSWLTKPVTSVIALKLLKPFFYSQSKIYD